MTNLEELLTREQRDILPEDAQKLYTEVYMRIRQQYDVRRDGPMSSETVASIAAMAAVTHLYERDEQTFRWHRKADPSSSPHKETSRKPAHSIRGVLLGILRVHPQAE